VIQFWFLWLFIAIVVVLVAFTLRKERDEMPRTDILRAVETSAGSMGLAEKGFPVGILLARYKIPNPGLLGDEQGCIPPHAQADAADTR